MDERSIVLRYQQGETEQLDDLVLLHADSLYRFCYHLCGNADSAAELFQDTWVKALQNINKCRAEQTILGWLFTIAANLHKDKYRRHMRWLKIFSRTKLELSLIKTPDDLVESERRSLVRQAVGDLDDNHRIPIMLYYFDDYSVKTISNLLAIPEGTVKSRLHQARKHLKNRLEVLL